MSTDDSPHPDCVANGLRYAASAFTLEAALDYPPATKLWLVKQAELLRYTAGLVALGRYEVYLGSDLWTAAARILGRVKQSRRTSGYLRELARIEAEDAEQARMDEVHESRAARGA